jgi:uncharacterized protein (UPF0333 family)
MAFLAQIRQGLGFGGSRLFINFIYSFRNITGYQQRVSGFFMKKRGEKAQVSIEFLMVVGFALLMTLPLVYIFFRQSETVNTSISSAQVDKVTSEIRDAADEVYYLGSPSKKTLTLFFPEGITQVNLTGNSMTFLVDSANGDYEVVKWTVGNISPVSNITTHSGIHHISLESGSDYVLITDK